MTTLTLKEKIIKTFFSRRYFFHAKTPVINGMNMEANGTLVVAKSPFDPINIGAVRKFIASQFTPPVADDRDVIITSLSRI
jgi:hypothetical protein